MWANHSNTRPNKPWLEEFLGKMHRSRAVAGGKVSERENREI
jgi:hypothetical protein